MKVSSPAHANPAATPDASFSPAHGKLLQRKCGCDGAAGLRGNCDDCDKKRLTVQRRAANQSEPSAVPPIVNDVLGSSGQPLDAGTRGFMESRFGHNFGDVRVHTDARAAGSARAVGALAYTVGRDVVFGEGQYQPETLAGRSTLAHELTHVVQQQGATLANSSAPLEIGAAGDVYEQEADATAHGVTRGAAVSVQRMITSSHVRRLQRQTPLDTHAGLFELARHGQLGGPTFVPQAQYDVRIEFLPYDIVNCGQIAMTQTVVTRYNDALAYGSAARRTRSLSAAEGTEGLGIDRLSGSTSPYYGTGNTGVTGSNAHFGSHTPGNAADRAWIEDAPGVDGATPASSRSAGDRQSFHFETCATCAQGTDQGTYYGCVSWGYDLSATDVFTEAPFTRISRGTPSADFIAAAKKWNDQTVPAATDDLPLPTHRTRNTDMTRAELDAEITSLQTTLTALAVGHANIPQITFELRVLRDIRDAIVFNEGVFTIQFEVRQVQAAVGATPTGEWTYETIQKLKVWQARASLPTTGRIDEQTRQRLDINQLGDFPEPSERVRTTA